ncbi:ATP-binding protein [Cellulomonas oligotrophica]|uniref:Serine/threonine-protein kinase RsbW n=1 Tax=Cellulomonas oligotrophica TaxID=931536 RepID=A0A7Y9JZK7_9CELL|nr:ATP-binding protein [Cellulomonas oligotrophica]NYD86300.1 serine/threonine-protein kinase RsbW [Cellulomonas oligotrophica]GIG32809.1 hypothetical protein Col01nite_19680 [Cellulomonas oligotrophica]
MPPDVRVRVPLDGDDAAGALGRVHAALTELWRAAPDVAEVDRIAVETAVVEVAGNVVEHGADGLWHGGGLEVRVDADAVVALLDHDGPVPVIDMDAPMPGVEAESGRGLPLTRVLVRLELGPHDGGVRWSLTRPRHP